MDDFGELRSLLHVDPKGRADAWDALVELMNRHFREDPKRTLEQWIPYAVEILDGSWTDAERVAPKAWIDAAGRGARKAALLQITRTFDMTRRRKASLMVLCQAKGLEPIRRLEWHGGNFTADHGRALRNSRTLTHVDTIVFTGGKLTTNASKSIGKSVFMPNLRHVVIKDAVLQPLALSMLSSGDASSLETLTVESIRVSSSDELDWSPLATADLPSLRHLSVAHSWFLGDTLFWILGAPSLANLESLDLARAPDLPGLYGPYDPDFDPYGVLTRKQILETFEPEALLTKAGMDPARVAKAIASI